MENLINQPTRSLSQKLAVYQARLLTPFVALLFFLLLAMAIRIHYLDTIRISSERQYRSAIIARAYYYGWSRSIPEWERQATRVSRERFGLLEPPVQEIITASIYLLINRENLWIPRFLSSLFWVVGGLFFYQIAKRMMTGKAAVVITAYYLFLPVGVLTSISFQPDSLMMMLLLISLLAIFRYSEKPLRTRLILAGIVSGLAILVKPVCIFTISFAFIALAVHQKIAHGYFRTFDFLAFFGLCLAPNLIYYTYGALTDFFLATQFEVSFLPHLLLDKRYWTGWFILLLAL